MAQVIPLRPHTFRLDNCVIDDYAAEMGAIGVAIYAVVQRYADRTTGQCWPSVSTMEATLHLSKNCVKKYLHHLARLGLIDMAPRYTADGDHTSNLYTVDDPTQTEALRRRRLQRGGPPAAGGGAPDGHEQDPPFFLRGSPSLQPWGGSEGCSRGAPPVASGTGEHMILQQVFKLLSNHTSGMLPLPDIPSQWYGAAAADAPPHPGDGRQDDGQTWTGRQGKGNFPPASLRLPFLPCAGRTNRAARCSPGPPTIGYDRLGRCMKTVGTY